jgi:hypothetical protein
LSAATEHLEVTLSRLDAERVRASLADLLTITEGTS